jgi:hypothetical protein
MKNFLKRYKTPIVAVLVFLVAILVYLLLVMRYSPEKKLEYVSFIFAAIAVIFAGISVITALNSLSLTRTTTRPFLNVQVNLIKGINPNRAIFAVEISNTGNLPADRVNSSCSWYIDSKNGIKRYQIELEKQCPTIIFPSDKVTATYLVNGKDNVNILTHEGSRIKAVVYYDNKLTGQKHTTQRTYRIAFASAATSFNIAQTIVIPEDDNWN